MLDRTIEATLRHDRGVVAASLALVVALASDLGIERIEKLFTGSLPSDAHPYFATLEGLRVSAHLLVRRDGELVQFVPVLNFFAPVFTGLAFIHYCLARLRDRRSQP